MTYYLKHKTLSQAPKVLSCELQIKSFMICMSHCTFNSLLISYGIINIKDMSKLCQTSAPFTMAKSDVFSQIYIDKFPIAFTF